MFLTTDTLVELRLLCESGWFKVTEVWLTEKLGSCFMVSRIMERGSSAPWSQILQETIGEGRLNGEALRDYFRPLEDWLRSENLRTGEYLGWSYDGDYCKFSIETAGLQVYGGFYNAAHRHYDVTSFVIILLISAIITVGFNLRWR
ncbi:hypothetical protein HF086_011510 [Spodoptera exigua]|uniref:Angiotensin-converting enzyme n=1 Tax=Spodoptera exigua TaxID=7107 RepID=A0A922M488_SPOEX|nr:hypothetical protein HF086_011510 [Spodoptera exigua]